MKPTIPLLAAAVAMGAVVLGVSPEAAHASGNVTVTLSSVSPSETVSITDLQGNDLTTQGLSLGSDNPLSTSLSSPFEVSVADGNQTPSGFTIDASMTNLYECTHSSGSCTLPSSEPTDSQVIPSNSVSLSYPTSTPAMAVENVSALAAPVFTVAGTLPGSGGTSGTLCAAAAALNTNLHCATAISISATVAGVGQTLAQTVNLANLSGLPIVPQAGTHDSFHTPAYGYGAVTYRTQTTGTALPVLSGSENASASVITALQNQITQATSVPNSYLDSTSLDAALQSAMNTALGTVNTGTTTLGDSVWVELQNTLVNPFSLASVEPAMTASLAGLGNIGPSCTANVVSCIVGISGTFRSFPILNVSVPAGTANGNFEGTLVFTGF